MAKRDEKKIKGRLIIRKKSSALVEVADDSGAPIRVCVPFESLLVSSDGTDVMISENDLEMGIPFGVPWEFKLKDVVIPAIKLARALRENGIWTAEDALKKPDAVKGALISSLSLSLSSIIEAAKANLNNEEML
jgi:hypothetical protein